MNAEPVAGRPKGRRVGRLLGFTSSILLDAASSSRGAR